MQGLELPPAALCIPEQPPQPNKAVPAGKLCDAVLLKFITWEL